MRLITSVKVGPHDTANVLADEKYVYVHVAGGFGEKHPIGPLDTDIKIEYIANEIIEHFKNPTTKHWKENKNWQSWDYYTDEKFRELIDSGIKIP